MNLRMNHLFGVGIFRKMWLTVLKIYILFFILRNSDNISSQFTIAMAKFAENSF